MSENGRIVIPAAFRKAMGLKAGEVVTIRMDEEGLHLQTRRQAIKRAQNIVKKYTKGRKGLVDEFLRERREEAARE
jgi:AbrB family looped-hinge helix DNA binding protein